MGAPEVTRFLTSLAVDSHVAASTQNQALSALLFLYREVLEVDLPWLDGYGLAAFPGKSAKICCTFAQPIPTAAASAFRLESAGRKVERWEPEVKITPG